MYTVDVLLIVSLIERDEVKASLARPFGDLRWQLKPVRLPSDLPEIDDPVLFAETLWDLDWSALFRHIEGQAWVQPRAVQLLITDNETDRYGLYELTDGRLTPVNGTAMIQQRLAVEEEDGSVLGNYAHPLSDEDAGAIARDVARELVNPDVFDIEVSVRRKTP